MKNLKRLFAPAFALCALIVGGVFVSCSNDTEEDENLIVTITEDGNETSKTVTMTYPEEYDEKGTVYIEYTIDGSDPDVEFIHASYREGAEYGEYFNYGTAQIYDKNNKPKFS